MSYTDSVLSSINSKISTLSAQLKNHKNQLKIITAYTNGSKIQVRSRACRWDDCDHPGWSFEKYEYRVKPTPVVRACKTFDEAVKFLDCRIFWHGNHDEPSKIIECVGNNKFKVDAHWTPISYDYMFEMYRLIDGSRIGVEEVPE